MSSEHFVVRFDGPALAEHKMDVRDLAPALMGLGDAIRQANQHVNEDRARVVIYVDSGFEHGCFLVHFQLWQGIAEQVGSLLTEENIATAKTILQWLGLLLPPGMIGGVLWYLSKRRGRRVTEVRDSDETGEVKVHIEGEPAPVVVNKKVFNISNNIRVIRPIAHLVSTLERPGIEEMTVQSSDGSRAKYGKSDAHDIIESVKAIEDQSDEGDVNIVTGTLLVHSPTFDPSAEKWRFLYGGKEVPVDISETSIARDVMERGAIGVNDAYRVRMEVRERRTPSGQYRHDYKVLEVMSYRPGWRQSELFSDSNDAISDEDS